MWTLLKQQRGMTLLELLVTIGVIAIVAAIAFPILGNVIPTTQDRAVAIAQKSVDDFVSRWNGTGAYSFDQNKATWTGYIDTNANGIAEENEAVEEFDINEDQYTVERTADDAPANAGEIDFNFTPIAEYIIGGGQTGSGGVLAFYDPVTLTYLNSSFTYGSNYQTLTPTVAEGSGDKTYSLNGTLPDLVSFDETSGTFTGPMESAWNFTATQVSTWKDHTCVVTTMGGVKCWGNNDSGQLGDGTSTNRSTPVNVIGLTSGITSINVGEYHTCAVTTSGGVKCWGDNNNRQLGDGTTTSRSTPVDVSGLTSGVESISAGGRHTCALTTSGGVQCWGNNSSYGQLGDGTYVDRSTPVNVSGLTSGVESISAGGRHTCAVTTTGGAKCWGHGGNAQLGLGNSNNSVTPANVPGLASGVSSISAGNIHTCASTTIGGAQCWGSNNYGQLGDGTTSNRFTPVNVIGLSGAASVSAGFESTCAITTSGGVKCWGSNQFGKLGDGTTTNRLTPVNVIGLSEIASIGKGNHHVCALSTTGVLKCWGYNSYGQLGSGITDVVEGCTTWGRFYDWMSESQCATYEGIWGDASVNYDSMTPTSVFNTGPQPGFPATVDVTVTDESGSATRSITLTLIR